MIVILSFVVVTLFSKAVLGEPNCAGVDSCRPRCVAFRFDRMRAHKHCESNRGAFRQRLGPWDMDNSAISICSNETWTGRLVLDLGLVGSDWEYTFQHVLSSSTDLFTVCAPHMCPKSECASPYQFGSSIRVIALKKESPKEDPHTLLDASLSLTQEFNGTAFEEGRVNRFGPLILDYLDDPQSCRPGLFTGIPLPSTPVEATDEADYRPDRFCEGQRDQPLPPAARESVVWQLVFHRVSRVLSDNEIRQLEKATRDYLRFNKIILESFTIKHQSLTEKGTLKLLVSVQAVNPDAAVYLFENDWNRYRQYVSDALPESNTGTSMEWIFSIMALALAMVALAATVWSRSKVKTVVVESNGDEASLESDGGWASAAGDDESSKEIVFDLVPSRPVYGTLVYI